GTSLDGLDLCFASFEHEACGAWRFHIRAAETIAYSDLWLQHLRTAHNLAALDFIALHKSYGRYLGEQSCAFLDRHNLNADYIASHGHTIFHQPQRGITFQLGDGAALAAAARASVICDFRSLDVALGGQGAPLVPVGDRLLFAGYDACLNLGGFANISYEQDARRLAFDVCPCNIALNALAQQLGAAYDRDGLLAQQGSVNEHLLASLNALEFYAQRGAKSLGREWVEEIFWPIVAQCDDSVNSKLRTVCEHVAMQVAACAQGRTMLVTGGGAFNAFLLQRMAALASCKVELPDAQIVCFKEALVFAFLGALYTSNHASCLASATGAARDCVGGCLVKY
ncbi:MAG: anhydro-N-acetylmuramic acid kinase, partial [Prevotellaceae bacterium]|nr:anhydro-N-acetylmuramic acid kinase [Prevotellaceae bacterium]